MNVSGMAPRLRLSLMGGDYAVCRLEPGAALPEWALQSDWVSVTRTAAELSVVCPSARVPGGVRREDGWRGLEVQGPLDFSLTGILASLAAPLAEAKIGLFALSTFDTDYLFVKAERLEPAIRALESAGHRVMPG